MSAKKTYERKPTEELESIRVQVPDWLAKDKKIELDVTGHLVAQSSKALLIRIAEDKEIWLPKSQIKILPLSLYTFFKPSKDSVTLE